MIPGYKPFFETLPSATSATLLPSKGRNDTNIKKTYGKGSNGSRGSSHLYSENMHASRDFDRNRQTYEQANPGRDPAIVESLYRAYIQRWMPDHKGDLPAKPPNTRGNAGLWRAWWKKVEGQNHG